MKKSRLKCSSRLFVVSGGENYRVPFWAFWIMLLSASM